MCIRDRFKGTPPALASDGPAQKAGSDEPAAGGVQGSWGVGTSLNTYGAGVRDDNCYAPIRQFRRGVPKSPSAEGGHLGGKARIRISKGWLAIRLRVRIRCPFAWRGQAREVDLQWLSRAAQNIQLFVAPRCLEHLRDRGVGAPSASQEVAVAIEFH